MASSSKRRDWEDWNLKSKRAEGFNIIKHLARVSWLLAHHARNKNNYVESLQVPHCRTELSDLGPDGKDDLSKCFFQATSGKWLLFLYNHPAALHYSIISLSVLWLTQDIQVITQIILFPVFITS